MESSSSASPVLLLKLDGNGIFPIFTGSILVRVSLKLTLVSGISGVVGYKIKMDFPKFLFHVSKIIDLIRNVGKTRMGDANKLEDSIFKIFLEKTAM